MSEPEAPGPTRSAPITPLDGAENHHPALVQHARTLAAHALLADHHTTWTREIEANLEALWKGEGHAEPWAEACPVVQSAFADEAELRRKEWTPEAPSDSPATRPDDDPEREPPTW
jgi:hypothetical protein